MSIFNYQSFRERLSLILIALLPFHAFLLTVITKLLKGPGHAPIGSVALWKEGVLGVILVLALVEIVQLWKREDRKQRTDIRHFFDRIDWLIIGLIALSIIVRIINYQLSIFNYVYGFKYDFLPLTAFLILRRVPWSEDFVRTLLKVFLWAGLVIAAYGIVSFVLPDRFFWWLGYSDQHSLYIASGPIAAFQQISGSSIRRIQSVMSGPNQLGLWLLIPWTVTLLAISYQGSAISRKINADRWRLIAGGSFGVCAVTFILTSLAIFLTFSRSAWIAALVIFIVALFFRVRRDMFKWMALGLGGLMLLAIIGVMAWDPTVFFRLSSNEGHLERPIAGIQSMMAHPFGLGLGTAGPATNRTNETCVFLRPEDDPSWAKATPSLCVFLGKKQVQPLDHVCQCPFLTENWYLQIGVELGVVGFILFIALIILILRKLSAVSYQQSANGKTLEADSWKLVAFLVFLGICVAALFLHAWEDSAVAYTVWMMVAAALRANSAHLQKDNA